MAARLLQRIVFATVVALFLPLDCATTGSLDANDVQEGIASFIHSGLHGNRTASGERYDEGAMTAAHRTLPFDTVVRVTNKQNGRAVAVRINDRGPFVQGRIIDLS